jgi:transcriptional regulator with XRE-family HTH domain
VTAVVLGSLMDGRLQRAIGQSLKRLRQSRGLSQEAFAAATGMHRTYLEGLERGEHNLTLKSVERIAGRIGIEPMTLLPVASRRVDDRPLPSKRAAVHRGFDPNGGIGLSPERAQDRRGEAPRHFGTGAAKASPRA